MKKKLVWILLFSAILTSLTAQSGRQKAVELTLKALELNDGSDKETALYEQAIQADASYAPAYYNLGNVYFDRKNYKKAVDFFSKASAKAKNDPDIWYNLGLASYLDKDYAAAVSALQTLIKISPKDHEGLYLLSKIYSITQSRTGYNAALQYLRQILSETRDTKLKDKASKLIDFLEIKMKLKK